MQLFCLNIQMNFVSFKSRIDLDNKFYWHGNQQWNKVPIVGVGVRLSWIHLILLCVFFQNHKAVELGM